MLNSGSPRYKRLWGEHLESRLLPKSIGICVSSPHPQALISGCGGHNSRCGYPPPNSFTLGRLLCYLSQRLGLGDCSPCLLPALPAPPHWCSAYPAPSKEEGGGTCNGAASLPSTDACSIVGGGVAAQKENKA